MSAKVYAVTHEIPDSHGGLFWSLSKKQAKANYREEKAKGYHVAMYEVDVTAMIDAALDDNLVSYEPSEYKDATLLKSHTPDESAGKWEGPRSLDTTPNELYMEYTENGDYWGFTVKHPMSHEWHVYSLGEFVGHVELQANMFPTFMSYNAKGILINTHVDFANALRTVAAESQGLPVK